MATYKAKSKFKYPEKGLTGKLSRIEGRLKPKVQLHAPKKGEGADGEVVMVHSIAGMTMYVKSKGQWWSFEGERQGDENPIQSPATYFLAYRTATASGAADGESTAAVTANTYFGLPFTHVTGRGSHLYNEVTYNTLVGNTISGTTYGSLSEGCYSVQETGLYQFHLVVTLDVIKVINDAPNIQLIIHQMDIDKDTKRTLSTFYYAYRELSDTSAYVTLNVHGTLLCSEGDSIRPVIVFGGTDASSQDSWKIQPGASSYSHLTYFEGFKIEGSH
jgi:hypothetical protein